MKGNATPDPQSGGCLCGKTRYTLTTAPEYAIRCYCRDCQHISGGGHAPQVAFKRGGFACSGPLKTYGLKSAAGNDVEVGFCFECGSPIRKTTSLQPGIVYVLAGSLDNSGELVIGN
ncbi:GFA family protein [Roseovarius sp. Pro17]|uniref:GFA family protein n=1 Tax=Roseovarius sp. Pro17 TaxID=3108175 RepID=UPI003A7F568C